MIERYTYCEELARSPHAVTTLRLDTERGVRCVLKSLDLGEIDDLKIIELFRREARVLRGLDHPGIPKLLEIFEERASKRLVLHLVQEYIEGENLAAAHERCGDFDEREVVRIARELLEILRYLHAFSPPVIHRDIKPGNVILATDGSVHLIDFSGVRDTLKQDRDVEGGFTIIGSYGYMPFEQYEGRAFPASDIYALGMTLIFLLTGREPKELEHDGMRLLVPHDARITTRFRKALEKMIEPDVDRRLRSVDEVALALPAEPVARKEQSPAAAMAGLAAAIVGLVVALVMLRDDPPNEARGHGPAAGVPRAAASRRDATSPARNSGASEASRQTPAWSSFELVAPDPARSQLVAQGLITFAAQPLGVTIPATPKLRITADGVRGDVTTPMRYTNGSLEIFDLEPGLYWIWSQYWDGKSQYNGGHEFRVEQGRVVQFEFHMTRWIQITAPADMTPREGFCEQVTTSPVMIAWKPHDDGTIYDYDVYENRCDNKGRAVPLTSGSTRELSLSLTLPPNKPGTRYQVNLAARRNGTWVGGGGMTFAVAAKGEAAQGEAERE